MNGAMVYEQQALAELRAWERKMQQRPGLFSGMSKKAQDRMNRLIPEKIHEAITKAFELLTKGLLTGANFIGPKPVYNLPLQEIETQVQQKIKLYQNTAAVEGAVTGAGGILLGLADLPLWLSIKVKMLADIAALYGHDTRKFEERLYILQILQLQFSSVKHRQSVYRQVAHWNDYRQSVSENGSGFDWRKFQQEYRDYLDIAKLLQLIPGIGAFIGAAVNHRMTEKLGNTAMMAYRLRWFG